MRTLVFLLVAALIWLFLRWLLRQPRKVWLQFTAIGIGLGLVALAATGRLHWLAALFGILLASARRLMGLINYVPLLHRLFTQVRGTPSTSGPSSGSTSHVESRYLRMSLSHDTGEMEGEVLLGRFEGRLLSDLSEHELAELLRECQIQDEESTLLLQAYIDRTFGKNWYSKSNTPHEEHTHSDTSDTSMMSRAEALEILGLNTQASREEIIEAHRRLIQKLHPDHGGSTYLAARVNQAKDLLLS